MHFALHWNYKAAAIIYETITKIYLATIYLFNQYHKCKCCSEITSLEAKESSFTRLHYRTTAAKKNHGYLVTPTF